MNCFKLRRYYLGLCLAVATTVSACSAPEEGSELDSNPKAELIKQIWKNFIRPTLISYGVEKVLDAGWEKGKEIVEKIKEEHRESRDRAADRELVDNYNRDMRGSTYDPMRTALTSIDTPQNYWIPLADANGDRKTDAIIIRRGPEYHIRGVETMRWGDPGDLPFFADMNADGVAELNVYRPSTGVFYSRSGQTRWYGNPGDLPYVGDFNGDGRPDYGVYRPSTAKFYIEGVETHFGDVGDVPIMGDFNGDGKSDIALYRPSTATFYIHGGSNQGIPFGNPGDVPAIGDYDGDGKDDIAIYRPTEARFYIRGQSPAGIHFGDPGDIPVCADYDGDGRTDIAVYRPRTAEWHIYGKSSFVYGNPGDIPGISIN